MKTLNLLQQSKYQYTARLLNFFTMMLSLMSMALIVYLIAASHENYNF